MPEIVVQPYTPPQPSGGLITETNEIYYSGEQTALIVDPVVNSAGTEEYGNAIELGFDTELIYYTNDLTDANFNRNNFKIFKNVSPSNISNVENYVEYTVQNGFPEIGGPIFQSYLNKNILLLDSGLAFGDIYKIKLNTPQKQQNFGGYSYIKLSDIINNFLVAYVGEGKLIPDVKRTDVIFHAKRALQEFSYDTLKSIKSQELNIPPSLSVILPQDYVNHVRCSWIDSLGVQHIIYPVNNLTSNPYTIPLQSQDGVPNQDNFGENLQGDSLTEERWKNANDKKITGVFRNYEDVSEFGWYGYDWGWGGFYGKRYGLKPETTQINGWYNINEREGKISFSSDLCEKLIILEYISDGLAYDLDTKVPKMAEDAMYAYINYGVLASRSNVQEYIVNRYKREKSAKLRNAKIRLSNIKLDEFVQVMRGKSKWIKH